MSGISRIEFDSSGFRDLLFSEGVRELVQRTADEIRDKANANYGGEGFVSRVQAGGYGGGRYIGFVTATDSGALKAESEDKALTRAIS